MRGTVQHEKTALVSAPRELAMPWESYSLTELDLVLGTVLKAFQYPTSFDFHNCSLKQLQSSYNHNYDSCSKNEDSEAERDLGHS